MEGMCCSLVSNHYEYKYLVVSLQLIEPVHSEVLIVLSNELLLSDPGNQIRKKTSVGTPP